MKKQTLTILLLSLFFNLLLPSFSHAAEPIIVDHQSVDLFDQIPADYLTAARNTRLLFSDRSVGQQTSDAIDCLAASSWSTSDNGCRKDYDPTTPAVYDFKLYQQSDFNAGTVPQRILFSSGPQYNRDNWTYVYRAGNWSELTQNFVTDLFPTYRDSKDILSYQFSYMNIYDDDNIRLDDPVRGFFARTTIGQDNPSADGRWNIQDIEKLEQDNPDKKIIYWTTSLSRREGTQNGANFNQQLRNYVTTNQKILFDIADIESHDPAGQPCYDNRDNVNYCQLDDAGKVLKCENNPNDNQSYPAICQDYTTETNGGHLGTVSLGKIRIAKAFWVMMAQVAGWTPNPSPSPSPTDIPFPTITPTPKPESTPEPVSPTPSPIPSPSISPAPETEIVLTTATTDDDVTEDGSTYSRNTSWFGTGQNLNASFSGLRFNQVIIPSGATIISASLEIVSRYDQNHDIYFDVYGERNPNTLIFSTSNRPSSRPLTTTKSSLSSPGLWQLNQRYNVGDVSTVIQEIVNQSGWASGNSLCLIAKGTSSVSYTRKIFFGAESGQNTAPRLTIKYR